MGQATLTACVSSNPTLTRELKSPVTVEETINLNTLLFERYFLSLSFDTKVEATVFKNASWLPKHALARGGEQGEAFSQIIADSLSSTYLFFEPRGLQKRLHLQITYLTGNGIEQPHVGHINYYF